MAKEYFVDELTTWIANNKGQVELQELLKKYTHTKVCEDELEEFVKTVDTAVDDINYKYPKCKVMTLKCSKMMNNYILLHIVAGAKDVASVRLMPILKEWKEVKK